MAGPEIEIENQLFSLFRRTFAIHMRTSSGEVELDRSIYGILCLIHDRGPQRLGAIAEAFRLDPSTITRQVQQAVRLGLAAKTPDPRDRRASILALTPEGTEAVEVSRGHRQRMLKRIMADWTDGERQEFVRSLSRFNDTIGSWLAEDEPVELG